MLAKLRDWIIRRQRERHGTDAVERETERRFDHMEQVVEDQKRKAVRVNYVYDRIAPPKEGRP